MAESKYMNIVARPSESGKTVVVMVTNKDTGALLGSIGWKPEWRCYTFRPASETLFDDKCLTDIQAQIRELTEARKPDTRG